MTVFERIESLRNQTGISQGKLEKELGFSNGSISKWKTSTPNPERLKKLADYFGTSLEYLMTGQTPFSAEMATTDIALSNMTTKQKDYALKLSKLPKDKQEHIMQLIDMLSTDK